MFLLLIGALLSLAAPLRAVDLCKTCHSQVEVEFRASAHYEEFTCATCHGGDPKAIEVAQAHGRGFRGKLARAQVPAFCAECHGDYERMRPYGLAADQYVLYQTSEHGRALAQGDARVAVCTDCHGIHRILHAAELKSPTHRQNISATCGRCHSDAAQMAPYGLPVDIAERYEASVHARALRQQGNPQAPVCTDCHSSHGAAPPGMGDVGKVCMHCHRQTREFFRLSPHQKPLAATRQGECAACHDAHRILTPDHRLWTTACVSCHPAGSEAARRGEKLLALFTQAEEEIGAAQRIIGQARQIPLDVADYEVRLSTATAYLEEARPLSHSLEVEAVEELTRKSRSVSQELQEEVREKIRVFEGHGAMAVFLWVYILITVLAIQLYKRAAKP